MREEGWAQDGLSNLAYWRKSQLVPLSHKRSGTAKTGGCADRFSRCRDSLKEERDEKDGTATGHDGSSHPAVRWGGTSHHKTSHHKTSHHKRRARQGT